MARGQVFAVLGGLLLLAGLLAAFGGDRLIGIGLILAGLTNSLIGWTRILQLSGKLRDPAPWERHRH
jgi:hypothetical protein